MLQPLLRAGQLLLELFEESSVGGKSGSRRRARNLTMGYLITEVASGIQSWCAVFLWSDSTSSLSIWLLYQARRRTCVRSIPPNNIAAPTLPHRYSSQVAVQHIRRRALAQAELPPRKTTGAKRAHHSLDRNLHSIYKPTKLRGYGIG
jgi:hypothetical protein